MPVDFFNEKCRTSSNNERFGLCDDPPPPHKPAYIDENNEDEWIGIVTNKSLLDVNFYAVDHCIELPLLENGKKPSRCDGILLAGRILIFVELKSRDVRRKIWLQEGIDQLISTINLFRWNADLVSYDRVVAHICNKKRPISHSGRSEKIQKFKDTTGLMLYTDQVIQL
ncbi:MAG: hypothetical protein K9J27_09485 [Bacteroidales bacterium]|nr:hypothetical protein [Bacteroidales bacterium]MCF8334621.1 hypothetical protein [Bacteroidales bacterium]